MKTYTFKIKAYEVPENVSPVIIAINCPLEVLYDSVKACKELSDFNGFITKTDYFESYSEWDGTPVHTFIKDDIFVGDVAAVFASSDLKDFLIHNVYIKEAVISDEV